MGTELLVTASLQVPPGWAPATQSHSNIDDRARQILSREA